MLLVANLVVLLGWQPANATGHVTSSKPGSATPLCPEKKNIMAFSPIDNSFLFPNH
jgi:hypothetical protein